MNDVCANYKVEHLYGWTKKGSSGSSSSLILVAVIEEMGAAARMERRCGGDGARVMEREDGG